MKITDIKLIEIKCPLKEPIKMSFGIRTERRHLFVKIMTDKGIEGIGDTWTNFPNWAVDERKITLNGIKHIFIGKDPLNINNIWAEAENKIIKSDVGLQYGAKGPIYQALSGIDIALWDIMGKAYGVPVYKLLGGTVNDHITAYASGITASDYKILVPKYLAEGFTAFKVKVGFGEETDPQTLRAVRGEIKNLELFADANQKWHNAKEAIKHINILNEYNIGFFEEPVNAGSSNEYRLLRKNNTAKLAAGENLYSRHEFHEYLINNLVDVIQPDVTKCGGITEAWAVCEEARIYGVKAALHMFGTAIGLAASLHVMFASPQAYMMEYDCLGNAMMDDLPLKTFYKLDKGRFIIDDELPGIGVVLNDEFMDRYII